MKIRHQAPSEYKRCIGMISPGVPIKFASAFHQDMLQTDIFIRLEVCSIYRPSQGSSCAKTPVANLRTGKLSYLDPAKTCRIEDCSVEVIE